MNTTLFKGLLIGACSTSLVTANPDEWTVTLVQKHLESAGVFQGEVEMEGNRVSFAPVPEGGSEFTLWAYRRGPNGLEEHQVDTEVVGAYLPKGRLWITTEDPYTGGIPRTRIDQGFTLNFEIEGLMSGSDAPKAAKRVLLDHRLASAEGDPKESNLGPEKDFKQSFITRNGPGGIQFSASNLPGTDIYNDSGVETFRLYALPDGETAELELSSAQVQIWPMSQASFRGISTSEVYTIAPEVAVDLVNLYPDSETWVQFYPGAPSPGTNGTRLTETVVIVNDDRPRDSEMILTKLDTVLSDNGTWTLEVITRTPFGAEVIESATIEIDRDLMLRGSFQALTD
ncbi:MAG: hypothetical protein ACSHYB_10200 [Roseibacillus sp.]